MHARRFRVISLRESLLLRFGLLWKSWTTRRIIDALLQIAILVLSALALLLVALAPPYARWGFVVGLASQPFWFAATWRARQYGMFALSVWYTGVWLIGIDNYF